MYFQFNHLDQYPAYPTGKTLLFTMVRWYTHSSSFYSSQGETAEAIKYLEKLVIIARNNLQSLDMIRACTMLGDIYNEKVSAVSFVRANAYRG